MKNGLKLCSGIFYVDFISSRRDDVDDGMREYIFYSSVCLSVCPFVSTSFTALIVNLAVV